MALASAPIAVGCRGSINTDRRLMIRYSYKRVAISNVCLIKGLDVARLCKVTANNIVGETKGGMEVLIGNER